MSDVIMISVLYGHSELVQVSKVENGVLWLGGYRIDYDRHGVETGRTEPSWHVGLYYDGGAGINLDGTMRKPWWKFW